MATEKNIVMKEFNGTDYDTLYPKTIGTQVDGIFTSEQTLTSNTKALYGLGTDAVPDEVFKQIRARLNGYAIDLALTIGGAPIASGVEVTGLKTITGETVKTDANGHAIGISETRIANLTVELSSFGYVDVSSATFTIDTGGKAYVEVQKEVPSQVHGEVQVTSSTNLKFSNSVQTVDMFLVGGGGGGGVTVGKRYIDKTGAQGGAGGQIVTRYAVALGADRTCNVQIGAAGVGGTVKGNQNGISPTDTTDSTDGGDTTAVINGVTITAAGGGAGAASQASVQSSRNTNGGGYGGRGNNVSAADNAGALNLVNSGRKFDDTSGTNYGSGGGGAYRWMDDDAGTFAYAGLGASGAGKAAASNGGDAVAGDATTYGSGGGAAVNVAGNSTYRYAYAGDGMQGLAIIRW